MNRIICVTGTGTEVGKTVVSLAMLLWAKEKGLRAGYIKLVQCGSRRPGSEHFQGDVDWIEAAQPQSFHLSSVYNFPEPVSPHLAAEHADAWIDMDWLKDQVTAASDRCDLLIVEGAGGAAVPFNREGFSIAELATQNNWPCLIACSPGLGTIHQSRTTAEFLKSRGAKVIGFAMSLSSPDRPAMFSDNVKTVSDLIAVPFFGLVPYCPGLDRRPPSPAAALLFAQSMDEGMTKWWSKSLAG